MTTHYSSKHGIIGRSNMELFMAFSDPRNITSMMPKDEKALQDVSIDADFDNLKILAKGITINVKIVERQPYSKIVLNSVDSPIKFTATLNFKDAGGFRTEFFIELDAEMNIFIKKMIGDKIETGLNKVINALVNQSAHI